MKREIYDQIVQVIENEEWDFDQVLHLLTVRFSEVKAETLRSILNQEYQKRVKRTHKSQTCDSKRREIFHSFNSAIKSKDYKEGVIVKLAKKNRFSPAQTGKIILEEYLKRNLEQDSNLNTKVHISHLMKNPALIEDQKLAVEIWRANLKDNNYGFTSECIKSSIGFDYEVKAKKALEAAGLSYQDEHELRAKGYDKTPDIKLDIPFAYNGHVINWIESKALFGDDEHHEGYLREQLWSYWNRYGPGMVIYWFGFIEDLDDNRDKGIIVCDEFPKDITLAQPLLLEVSSDEDLLDNES